MIKTAPCAPICQSGEIRRKDRNDAVSVSVIAPRTAPTGEIRPPTNSPPPRINPCNGKQGVAQRNVGIRRCRQPDQRQARENAEDRGQGIHGHFQFEHGPARARNRLFIAADTAHEDPQDVRISAT